MIEKEDIRPANLSKEAAAGIQNMIFNGDLEPGERINEKILCEKFNLSRTPLREALKVLGSEGLIELLPNRGARVVRIESHTIDEIFPVMSILEGLAGELAAINISDEKFAEIQAAHFQMVLEFTRGELAGYFFYNQRIHDLIVLSAGDKTLVAVYRALSKQIRLARLHANIPQERWKQAMNEHEAILKALEMRDGYRLGTLLREHLLKTCKSLKQSLEKNK